MDKYTSLCEQLSECGGDMKSIIDQLMKTNSPAKAGCGAQEPIQPDSNIGEFGANKDVTSISIMKEEDGSVKITTDALCVKLHQPVIEALKKFIEMEQNISEEE